MLYILNHKYKQIGTFVPLHMKIDGWIYTLNVEMGKNKSRISYFSFL